MLQIYEDLRQDIGRIVRNKYGQYFYICGTCFCEFLCSESFRKHQKNAHAAPISFSEKSGSEKNQVTQKVKANYAISKPGVHPPATVYCEKRTTVTSQPSVTLNNLNKQETTSSAIIQKKALKKYKCKICSQIFEASIDLDSHTEQCNNKSRKKCDYCIKTFGTAQGLQLHARKNHQSTIPFLCNVCPKGFNNRYELVLHKRQHDKNPWIECDFCKNKFRSGYEKDNHLKRCHPFATYQCKRCTYQCKNEGKLRRHECSVVDLSK